MHNGQLKQLLWQMKLQACSRVHKALPAIIQVSTSTQHSCNAVPDKTATPHATDHHLLLLPPPGTQLEYVPFCRATDTPMVLSTCRDGTLTFLRIHEKVSA